MKSLKVNKIIDKLKFFENDHFSKIGRSTGLTRGLYSHIESDVQITLPRNSSHREGHNPPVRHTQEFMMVGEDGQRFSGSGDSGSWVFNFFGSLTGLIWGSSADNGSYVTPIWLVIKDIEERTGMKVELL